MTVGRGVGTGIAGVAAAIGCVLAVLVAPVIFGMIVEDVLSSFGLVRIALTIIVAAFTSWFLQVSLGTLVLALVVAVTIGAVIGGFVGAFLGSLGATVVLERHRQR